MHTPWPPRASRAGDPRESYFNLCRETLDRLPVPWIMGWTTAFSLHRVRPVERLARAGHVVVELEPVAQPAHG